MTCPGCHNPLTHPAHLGHDQRWHCAHTHNAPVRVWILGTSNTSTANGSITKAIGLTWQQLPQQETT